jgi:phosphatidate cytidylyltransferase
VLRIASAAVLAPAVLLSTYAGGWVFRALCAIAAGAIVWEWTSLVSRDADPRIVGPGLTAVLAATVLVGLGLPGAAFAVIVLGAALAGLGTAVWPGGDRALAAVVWAAAGVVYAGAALLGPAVLRHDPEWGFTALLFLFAIVWAVDIFAYFVGRAVGGPLLWPRVSPKKTWAGAIGGLAGGVAAGVSVAYASGLGGLWIVGILAFMLSLVAQAGDLLESAIKRRFGAKDAGQLIPGHGGVMDRLDGFLVAAFAALLIGILRDGTGASARGLLVW